MQAFRYLIKRKGQRVVNDFERLLTTGDVSKITPGLYHALTMHGGFIAHFDIHGFRATYSGKLTDLLRGEYKSLANPESWARDFNTHLEDSGYVDGLSAGDVMRQIARVGARMHATVELRERLERDQAEAELLRQLAERRGMKVVPR
jgi:hypothetical protein